MKYSVIIPTLNEVRLLPNLLEPLSTESLKDKFEYEIILADGGSTDGTLEIARHCADEILVAEEKENIAAGRNRGAKVAKGEVLVFLNADVTLDVKAFFEYLESNFFNRDYLGMTCAVKIDPREETLADKIFLGFYNLYFHFLNIIGVGMGRGECLVVRKEVFEKLGGFNENLAAGEDFDLFRRVRKKGKILFARSVTVFESPRRFRKFGHVKIFLTWTLNGLFVILKNKSLSKKWEEVR